MLHEHYEQYRKDHYKRHPKSRVVAIVLYIILIAAIIVLGKIAVDVFIWTIKKGRCQKEMSKKQYEFKQLEKSIERYRKLSTEKILQRLTNPLTPIASKAYKIVLKERDIKV